MEELDTITRAVLSPIQLFWAEIVAFTPNLLAAATLLVVGYALGRIVRFLFENLLSRAGLDRFGATIGVDERLSGIKEGLTLSTVLGALAFWFIFLAFFISASDALQLPGFSAAIDDVVHFLPNVVGAIAVLLVGLYFGRLARETTTSGLGNLGAEYARTLGSVVYLLVVLVTVSLAVSQLNIETALFDQVVGIVLVGAIAAIALAVGLGGRTVAGNVIAGIYLRELIQPGERVEMEGVSGRLAAITAVTTIVEEAGGGRRIVANQQVLEAVVEVSRDDDAPD